MGSPHPEAPVGGVFGPGSHGSFASPSPQPPGALSRLSADLQRYQRHLEWLRRAGPALRPLEAELGALHARLERLLRRLDHLVGNWGGVLGGFMRGSWGGGLRTTGALGNWGGLGDGGQWGGLGLAGGGAKGRGGVWGWGRSLRESWSKGAGRVRGKGRGHGKVGGALVLGSAMEGAGLRVCQCEQGAWLRGNGRSFAAMFEGARLQ